MAIQVTHENGETKIKCNPCGKSFAPNSIVNHISHSKTCKSKTPSDDLTEIKEYSRKESLAKKRQYNALRHDDNKEPINAKRRRAYHPEKKAIYDQKNKQKKAEYYQNNKAKRALIKEIPEQARPMAKAMAHMETKILCQNTIGVVRH